MYSLRLYYKYVLNDFYKSKTQNNFITNKILNYIFSVFVMCFINCFQEDL